MTASASRDPILQTFIVQPNESLNYILLYCIVFSRLKPNVYNANWYLQYVHVKSTYVNSVGAISTTYNCV